ncbi:MAG: ATP synthase subunit I [Peptococcaceae bacterium]|nr:ATP synthase subunit I [Peptococcaceae bacterium]
MFGDKPVPELDSQLKRTIKISLCILAGVCLALGFDPRDGVFWGLAIGIATGIYNSVTLARRIKRLPGLSPDSAKKFMKRGLVFRLGLIMAVLLFVSQRLPSVNLLGVGAGLLVPYYVSINLSLVESFRLYRRSQAFMKRYYGK